MKTQGLPARILLEIRISAAPTAQHRLAAESDERMRARIETFYTGTLHPILLYLLARRSVQDVCIEI